MGYGKEIYAKAENALSIRRQRAMTDADARRERIYSEMPDVRELEMTIAHTGVSTAKAIFAGGDAREQLIKLRDENLKTQTRLRAVLASHGYTPEDLEERWFCPSCKDKGYYDGRMCGCMKQLLRDIAYSELNSMSPLPLEQSRFDTFSLEWYSDRPDATGHVPRKRMENIYRYCIKYAEGFGKNSETLLMDGGTGLGKTHLSLAIARRVLERGFGVIYGSAPDLLTALEREQFSRDSDYSVLERLEQCDLLIFDDLGTEFSKSFTKAAVYNLLNSRLTRRRATIINTNMTLSELSREYSDRLISRLIGENTRLNFVGDDVRIAKKRKMMSDSF
ncbi:MAG: ATP-binding protein [Clostridia bacterium]|nr:ATP-binding protein [Clostridia bacterium]